MSSATRRPLHRILAATAVAIASAGALAAAPPTVVELTQTPCQFLEPENGIDHQYQSRSSADCEAVNARTAEQRLAKVQPLRLRAGTYIFRVSNRNVPYPLGFWLRGDGAVNRALLPSVSGGGLARGTQRDYQVRLKPGRYVFSCPLNPTPSYPLVVTE